MKANEIQIVNSNNGIRIEVSGEFTTATSETIKKELAASQSREGSETLDLTKASMMDVVGIQLAYAWKKALKENQRTGTVILPTSESIKDLFVKTGITQIL
jgi:anti-anti-sigma factor